MLDQIDFPLLNASLNSVATLLLIVGYGLIKVGREQAHRWTMVTAFGVSVVFLVSYLAYHVWPIGAKATPFSGEGVARIAYYVILVPHILLAMAVPWLAMATIYLGFRDRRKQHRRLARWTFPIWLYVSVTGVLIYLMLYQWYPAEPGS